MNVQLGVLGEGLLGCRRGRQGLGGQWRLGPSHALRYAQAMEGREGLQKGNALYSGKP